MAYNTGAYVKVGTSFHRVNYPTHWNLIDGMPTNFTPTYHTHDEGTFYIEGTGTVDGTWLGSHASITGYYVGLKVFYRIPRAGASTVTLNINGLGAKIIYRYSNSKLTTHFSTNAIIPLVYTTINDGGCWVFASDTYDSTEDYNLRWQNTLIAGAAINGHKIVMQGVNGRFYPLTIEAGTGTTKTVATNQFLLGGTILYYNSGTVMAAGVAGGGYYFYESLYTSNLHYTANSVSGRTAYLPIYLKGTVDTSGAFILDNTTYTSWLTQTLPTAEDGFVYILIGYMNDTANTWRLVVDHPIFHYKDGGVRLYQHTNTHTHTKSSITDFPTSMPASDVYAWAKAPTKPSYNQDDVGDGTTYKRVTQTEKNTWNAKQNALGFTPYNATNPSGYISSITKTMVEAVLTGTITTHGHSYVPLPNMAGNAGKIMKINSSENGFDLATALTGGYTQIFLVAGNNSTAADGSEIIVSGYNDLVIVLSSASDGTTTTNSDYIYVNKSWCAGGTLPNFPSSDFYLDSAWLYIMWDFVSANGKYVAVWAR